MAGPFWKNAMYDIKIFYFFNNLAGHSAVLNALIVFLADYLQYFLGALFLLLLFFSAYSKKEKLKIFWIAAISVAVARLGIVSLIRFFYHRPRPFLTLPVHQLIADNEYSFPSGHAAFFFAMAMAIYFYNKKWGAWFFAAAVLITAARVAAGVHYPTDILGGAIVGVLTAWAVFYFSKKWKTKQ